MKKLILEAIIQPFLAIAFCVGFGGFFVYAGFQSVRVELTRSPDGEISAHVTRKHFLGPVTFEEQIAGVQGAGIETRRHRSGGRRTRLGSGAVIYSDAEEVPLFAGFSNVDTRLKRDIVNKIDAFVESDVQTSYAETFHMRNVFGWVGLPFFAIGVLGLLGWPFSIVSYWGKGRG